MQYSYTENNLLATTFDHRHRRRRFARTIKHTPTYTQSNTEQSNGGVERCRRL